MNLELFGTATRPPPAIPTELFGIEDQNTKIAKLKNQIHNIETQIEFNRKKGYQMIDECIRIRELFEQLYFSLYIENPNLSYSYFSNLPDSRSPLNTREGVSKFADECRFLLHECYQFSFKGNQPIKIEPPLKDESLKQSYNNAHDSGSKTISKIAIETQKHEDHIDLAKLNQRIKELYDSGNTEEITILGQICQKAAAIRRLQDLKELNSAEPKTISGIKYSDFEPETILRSPFYVNLQLQCQGKQIAKTPFGLGTKFERAQNRKEYLASIAHDAREAIELMKHNHILHSAHTDLNFFSLRHTITPLISLLTEPPQKLDEYDFSLRQMQQVDTAFQTIFNNSNLEQLKKSYAQYRDKRAQVIHTLCKANVDAHQSDHKLLNDSFKKCAEITISEEQTQLRLEELSALPSFIQDIQNLSNAYDVERVDKWCEDLHNATSRFINAVERKRHCASKSPAQTQAIDSLRQQIDDLFKENYSSVDTEVRLAHQLLDAKSNLLKIENDYISEEIPLPEVKQYIICPLCKERERSCISGNCGHAFCRECISGIDKCPICGKAIDQTMTIPFSFE